MAEKRSDSISLEEATEIVVALLPKVVDKAKAELAKYNKAAAECRKDYGDFLAELVEYRTMGFFKRLGYAFGLYRPGVKDE